MKTVGNTSDYSDRLAGFQKILLNATKTQIFPKP
jgi:hypothetical protein